MPPLTVAEWTSITSAAATVAVAVFAGVQIWRETRALQSRRRAALLRISTSAYCLRERLLTWLGRNPGNSDGLGDWVRRIQKEQRLSDEVNAGIDALREIAGFAADAPEGVSDHARIAFVTPVQGTRKLGELARLGDRRIENAVEWADLLYAAHTGVLRSLEEVQSYLIERQQLASEAVLHGAMVEASVEKKFRWVGTSAVDDDAGPAQLRERS